MAEYSRDIGIWLGKKAFNDNQIKDLKSKLTSDIIIRVYGLAGVGKGTLSSTLASTLGIPVFDSGKIWRALTYIYNDLALEDTLENTQLVFSKIDVFQDNTTIRIRYGNKIFQESDLKNAFIDARVFGYAAKEVNQQEFFKFNVKAYNSH